MTDQGASGIPWGTPRVLAQLRGDTHTVHGNCVGNGGQWKTRMGRATSGDHRDHSRPVFRETTGGAAPGARRPRGRGAPRRPFGVLATPSLSHRAHWFHQVI